MLGPPNVMLFLQARYPSCHQTNSGQSLYPSWISVVINVSSEWLRERTEHLNIFLFFHPSLNHVLFLMSCLLVEGECQILVF